MKNLFFVIICLLFYTHINAQIYNNEWINYSKTYYKIKVARNGLHRIPYTTLNNNGLNQVVGSSCKMFYKGKEIPLYVSNNSLFTPTDYIEFVGTKNNGEFDAQLYFYPQHQLTPQFSLFSDTSAYYLTFEDNIDNLRFKPIDNNLNNLPAPETDFINLNEKLLAQVYYEGKPFNIGETESNYADFEEGEGFASLQFETLKVPLKNSAVSPNAPTANIEVRVVGASNNSAVINDHHLQILLNNTLVLDTLFEGYTQKTFNFNVASNLLATNDTITFIALKDVSATNRILVAYVKINYAQNYNFDNVNNKFFTISNNADKYLEINNFNGSNQPILYDLTNNIRLLPTLENTTYRIFLPQIANSADNRNLLISNSNAITAVKIIDKLQAIQFTDFTNPNNQGNYLIISHPVLQQGNENYVQQYLNYRKSDAGGAYTAVLANIEELYDQFAFGIAKHPFAIRNFIQFALKKWNIAPKYLLLMGKGLEYGSTRFNSAALEKNLIPTYGHFPSDVLLTSSNIYNSKQRVATGRIPALTPNDVRIYLQKIIQYENYKNLPCTRAERLWTKNALHIAGGDNLSQSEQFLGYLNKYKNIFSDTLYGGNVALTYNKLSSNPIVDAQLDDIVNNGLGVISFIGHSSGNYWAVNLKPPTEYQNYGKFPFIFTGSCFVGNMYQQLPNTRTMPEDYLFAENLGAIGFLATTTLGVPSSLDLYLERVYKNFCTTNYNKPIGYCIQRTILEVDSLFGNQTIPKATLQQYAFAGDPALVITSYQNPEYVIEDNAQNADLSFIPSNVSADMPEFNIKLIITNLEKAVPDSITIKVERTLPSGNTIIALLKKIPSPAYIDTVLLPINNTDPLFAGQNTFTVTVDADNQFNEHCESNNTIVKSLYIFSDVLIPISPCKYSIVSNPNVVLYASTGQPILPVQNYVFEIDTTAYFNSPFLQKTQISSSAGVLQWQPNINYQNNRVYFWRTASIPPDGITYKWRESSFVYIANSESGWQQSHIQQFDDNKFDKLYIDSLTNEFKFKPYTHLIEAHNEFGNLNGINFFVDSNLKTAPVCVKNNCTGGLGFAVFKTSNNFENYISEKTNNQLGCNGRGTFGNLHCDIQPRANIEFNTSNTNQLDSLLIFLNNINDGYYVLAYSIGNHRLNAMPNSYKTELAQFFEGLGLPEIINTADSLPFIAFGAKNKPDNAFKNKSIATTNNQALTLQQTVQIGVNTGTLTSEIIGPAKQWNKLTWATQSFDATNADKVTIEVWGNKNGVDTLLISSLSSPINLQNIPAATFNKLTLKAIVSDTVFVTPPQWLYWQVLYNKCAELALNQSYAYNFNADTLERGDSLKLKIAVTNASSVLSDSIKAVFTIINNNNIEQASIHKVIAALNPFQTSTIEVAYSTQNLVQNNLLTLTLNPNNAQPEKTSFNNLLFLPFFVKNDKINPYIDVTFDGIHILEGDIVSAKPNILIKVKDDSKYLALNNVNDIKLSLLLQNGTEQPILSNDSALTFTPATAQNALNGNNSAILRYAPALANGRYTLIVKASDRSGNSFAKYEYRIGFEVINENLISHVLNYPNPFSTQTQFLFTLTGSEVPQNLSIEIRTVSGKVVRTITQSELGNLHIGTNLSSYAWNGTDQFGNQLANGVYLYRVIANKNGKNLDIYNNAVIDNLFNNGWGKLYLLR